jgi:serine protease AprX
LFPSVPIASDGQPRPCDVSHECPRASATLHQFCRAKALGISIAIIEGGINQWHPDFAAYATTNPRIVYNQSFVPADTYTGDDYGHGTHVAGIAAGVDNIAYQLNQAAGTAVDPRWFDGVAEDASIVNLKALDMNANGQDSNVIAASTPRYHSITNTTFA